MELTKILSLRSFVKRAPDFEKAKSNIRVKKYETDRLEQYTRREKTFTESSHTICGVVDESYKACVLSGIKRRFGK